MIIEKKQKSQFQDLISGDSFKHGGEIWIKIFLDIHLNSLAAKLKNGDTMYFKPETSVERVRGKFVC